MTAAHRIGLIVPSSNVTMETELPVLFARNSAVTGRRFTFHSARMRMTSVTPEALAAMNAQGERCAAELADCRVRRAGICLPGRGDGSRSGRPPAGGVHPAGRGRWPDAGGRTPVVTSAGALIDGIRALDAERVAMIAPYAPPLTAKVVAYLAARP